MSEQNKSKKTSMGKAIAGAVTKATGKAKASKEEDTKSRLEYLGDKFGVFTQDQAKEIFGEEKKMDNKDNVVSEDGKVMFTKIEGVDDNGTSRINAIKETIITQDKDAKKARPNVRVSENILGAMMKADPTKNFVYVQWMLTVFTNLIKDGETQAARRFADEDLGMANEYLTIFEKHKRKKLFAESCKRNGSLPNDPTNINQYTSLAQLYDAVDPFLERDTSQLEAEMKKFVAAGQGEIAFRDRKWTVWVPLTREANVIMNPYASWCTAHPGGSYYGTYTNQRRPDGDKSKIYCIINNDVYAGKSNEVYQIHFESNQIKCRRNSSNVNIYEPVLSTSKGISEYFRKELDECAKMMGGDINNNKYIDYLISFGFAQSYFDYMDENVTEISINGKTIPKLPDISKFQKMDQLLLVGIGLTELHPSIGSLQKLELLSLSENKIKKLPKEIGNLKNLDFLNIKKNPIEEIPEEIAGLDPSNGGSLYRVAVSESDIGKKNYEKLQKLLPTVKFGV